MAVEIADWNDLDNVRNDLDGDYVLVNDLDEDTDGYAGIGDDFEPIGFIEDEDLTFEFGGSFDGDGFEIADLVIEYDGLDAGDIAFFASTDDGSLIENLSVAGSVTVTNSENPRANAGLVGRGRGGTIQSCVSHVDVTVPDGSRVGGLVGYGQGTVTDCYATGSVEGSDSVGGLVGRNSDTVEDSYATGSVEGDEFVGGLVGNNDNTGTVTDSYATGSVEVSDSDAGGLVGRNSDTVEDSYATGSVDGGSFAGGLVGYNFNTVEDSYATGSVEGSDEVGGLVARNQGTVEDSYATGSVEGSDSVGGLVGFEDSDDPDGGIRRCYSYGTVTGSSSVGGFCGILGSDGFFGNEGYIFDSYVDIDDSGQDDAIGEIGDEGESDVTELSTSEMQGSEAETNMDGFDFADMWDSVLESDEDTTADGYPILLVLDRENQLEVQGIFQELQPPEPPENLTAELL